ncbi:MAG TPA: 1-deoxy-D-xylulose-5-phosphate reductoisomerase [Rhodospirillales bacterium]|jgi:1-deoxy-D-xylulose-5-phosphate reductoisomerase|nr:1-deoxy-D-xylulose-5-phosphate reductoisomerase [Rhodospirillales bacterium]
MVVRRSQPRAETAPRRVTILGSTGSVGGNTIDLVQRQLDTFQVEALTTNCNIALLADQARRLGARFAAAADASCYRDLKKALSGSGIEAAAGAEAIIEAASRPAEWVMASIVGMAGLEPTMAAAKRGAIIGLANKECLVSAGDVLMKEIARCGGTLLPVDSEHSAIFQVFDFANPDKVARIILTASGGPFREMDITAMARVTPEQALAHPNWDMGAKISVDCATMMNKGLELIEARHLFPVPEERIEILVHPQSVVHSLVDYVDGSVLAQLGTPDMRAPISYALGWPKRMPTPAPRLSLAEIGTLTFEAPNLERFPALRVAREALQAGGGAPTIMNAANEVAVESFLSGRIDFLDIIRIVEQALEAAPEFRLESLSDVINADDEARDIAKKLIKY